MRGVSLTCSAYLSIYSAAQSDTHTLSLSLPLDATASDERILSLEMSISRLQEHMTGVRDEVHVISKTLYTKVRSLRRRD